MNDEIKASLRLRTLCTTAPKAPPALWARIKGSSTSAFFPAGSVIYLQDSSTEGFFFIESGTVRVYQVLEDGTDVTIEFFSERSIFGEASALCGDLGSPMASAQTDVTARFIPTETACTLLEKDSEFAMFVITTLVHKLRMSTSQLSSVAGKRVSARLADALLSLDGFGVQRDSEDFYIISHAELASLISTTRSNTTVMLNRLLQRGVIATKRRGIKVVEPEKLRQLSDSQSF